MATTIRTETRKRGFFGTIVWWIFLAWNILMGFGFVMGMKDAGDVLSQKADPAWKAGASLGATMGAGMILTVWLLGSAILGLVVALTRGKKVTIEKTID